MDRLCMDRKDRKDKKDRKKVAVFTANIYRDMAKDTQYGLIQAAKREGVKLLFFSAFSDNFSTFT